MTREGPNILVHETRFTNPTVAKDDDLLDLSVLCVGQGHGETFNRAFRFGAMMCFRNALDPNCVLHTVRGCFEEVPNHRY